MEDAEKLQHLQKLTTEHNRRLKALEIKAAKYGPLECPVTIELEINEIKETILAINAEINSLQANSELRNELLKRIREDLIRDRPMMLEALERRKIKLRKLEKRRARYRRRCPSLLLEEIENDKCFIE